MHLVFLNQYYPPDAAPTGVMLEGVVGCLVKDGHEVTVLCASGGYAGAPAGREELAVSGGRLAVGEDGTGDLAEEPDSQPTANRQQPTDSSQPLILRIGATRFGRKSFSGKLADYASYYAGVKWKLMTMQPRPDRVIALTTPPYLSILARAFSKLRGGEHAHWVMDLYPDVMVAHGMLKEGGMAHRLLALFARWGFGGKRCAAVVTLGPDMADRLGAHVGAGRKVEWVPLWGGEVISDQWTVISEDSCTGDGVKIETAAAALRRERRWGADELVVMYSGNMGRGHRLGEIFAAAKVLAERNGLEDTAELDSTARRNRAATRFVFFGGGKRKGEVSEFAANHPECGVELHDYSSADKLREHLQSADLQLASLDGNWTGTMVPSKLQGIFGVGRPAIFIGSRESSIAKWILGSGGGWVVEPGDVQGLVAAIDEGRDPGVRRVRGEAAAAFAAKHFSKEINSARVARLLRKIRS